MSSGITIKLTGFKELGDKLRAFGPEVAKNGLRQADYAAASVIAKAVQNTAPVRTGLLKANIYPSRRHTPDNVAEYSVIVRRHVKVTEVARRRGTSKNIRKGRAGAFHGLAGPAVYGEFIEFGTSKMAPRPFMRPAFVANVQAAIDADKARLARAVADAASK